MSIKVDKEEIEQIAQDEGMSVIDVISTMQAGAAALGHEDVIGELAELKNKYIEEMSS